MKNITLEVKTVVAPFWALFGKIGLLFIPTSGHTDFSPSALNKKILNADRQETVGQTCSERERKS